MADEFEIRPAIDRMPGLLFVPVAQNEIGRTGLIRFRPADQAAKVERLVAHGVSCPSQVKLAFGVGAGNLLEEPQELLAPAPRLAAARHCAGRNVETDSPP